MHVAICHTPQRGAVSVSPVKRLLLVGLVAVALAGSATSGAGGTEESPPCHHKRCVASLLATGRVQHWKTPQVFSSRQGISSIAVNLARGKRKFGVTWDWCNATIWRAGVIVRVKSCGDPAAIRLTYRAVGEKPVPFRMIYWSVR